jgi:hypothetical protein
MDANGTSPLWPSQCSSPLSRLGKFGHRGLSEGKRGGAPDNGLGARHHRGRGLASAHIGLRCSRDTLKLHERRTQWWSHRAEAWAHHRARSPPDDRIRDLEVDGSGTHPRRTGRDDGVDRPRGNRVLRDRESNGAGSRRRIRSRRQRLAGDRRPAAHLLRHRLLDWPRRAAHRFRPERAGRHRARLL